MRRRSAPQCNDAGDRRANAFSRRNSARVLQEHGPQESRGRRESRMHSAPIASYANKKAYEQVTTGPPKQSGLPCAMVYDLFCALPGVHDLLATVARAMRKAPDRELGTSQGVPGVESRRGAVVAPVAQARFLSPLIKPDVRISRIRLSDWLHGRLTRGHPHGGTGAS